MTHAGVVPNGVVDEMTLPGDVGLGYDDVLLVPRRSRVSSRRDVSTRSLFTPAIEVEVPIVSANMDTVTTAPMAIAMAQLGGIGVIHRFLPIGSQCSEVESVKRYLNVVIDEPFVVGPGETVAQARAEAQQRGVSGLPVTDGGRRLLGILTARDQMAAHEAIPVAEAMTPIERLVTASPGIAIDEARRRMHDHRIEKLPLVDSDGLLVGLMTMRDLKTRDQFPSCTIDSRGRLAVGAAIGVRGDYLARAEALLGAGADVLVLDIAHGHSENAIQAIAAVKAAWRDVEVVAGNVVTGVGVRDLALAGADAVKVGVGAGLACTTRMVAGVGRSQLSAVIDCAITARKVNVPIIADGGIRHPGDLAKAIGAGANTVMVGGLLAGCLETPGNVVVRDGRTYKGYRGMASWAAYSERVVAEGAADSLDQYVPEGQELEVPLRGPVAEVIIELVGGLRSAMSYSDSLSVPELWDKAIFEKQTSSRDRAGT